jgi:hypothetical protein
MKTIWSILSVAAVANLIALAGIIAYLSATGRLDGDRLREVRQLFTQTTAQRAEQAKLAGEKAVIDAAAAKEQAKVGTPPITAGDAMDLKLQQSQIDAARIESLKREVQILQETLARQKAALDSERVAFEKQKKDFELARETVQKTESDEQFRKALATIEGLKADKAKAALQTLIDQQQTDQAVSYLNAMQERTRTKILDVFIKADPKVATDLLERLRTRGVSVAGLGGPP